MVGCKLPRARSKKCIIVNYVTQDTLEMKKQSSCSREISLLYSHFLRHILRSDFSVFHEPHREDCVNHDKYP